MGFFCQARSKPTSQNHGFHAGCSGLDFLIVRVELGPWMQHAFLRSTYMPGSALQGQQGQQRSPHSVAFSAVVSKPGYRAITAPLERSLRSSSSHFQSESTLASRCDTATRSCTFWHEAPRCSVNGVLRRRSSLLLPFGSTQALHSRLQPWRTVP